SRTSTTPYSACSSLFPSSSSPPVRRCFPPRRSSDLGGDDRPGAGRGEHLADPVGPLRLPDHDDADQHRQPAGGGDDPRLLGRPRSEEHTSELQSVKISYAVVRLKRKAGSPAGTHAAP